MLRADDAAFVTVGALSREEAAAHVGFSTQTFNIWVQRGLLRRADPITGGWTKEAHEAIERAQREGVQHDNPSRRHSHFVKIYHCKHYWRARQSDGGGWHFYFTPTWETLPGPWGGPAFMTALIAAERRYATQHRELAANPLETPQATEAENHFPPVARPSPAGTAEPTKVVTQEFALRLKDGLRSPAELAGKMRRRRAKATQAEIARIIRRRLSCGSVTHHQQSFAYSPTIR
jgi:hypothetical protein